MFPFGGANFPLHEALMPFRQENFPVRRGNSHSAEAIERGAERHSSWPRARPESSNERLLRAAPTG